MKFKRLKRYVTGNYTKKYMRRVNFFGKELIYFRDRIIDPWIILGREVDCKVELPT
jgi:hypothetical protein